MGSHEATKKRILPGWMIQKEAEPQWEESKQKRRKKRTFTRIETVYCMNEAELVDTALCILAEKWKVEETEVPSSQDEAQGCLSVPARPSCSTANGSNAATADTAGTESLKRLEDLGCSEKIKSEDDEGDALKYVREIFFT